MKISINGPGRKERARLKREYKLNWHKKFAWLPTIVDETDKSYSIVWGEIYMRRMLDRSRELYSPRDPPSKKKQWSRISKTEYLKQKLAGTLPPLTRTLSENVGYADDAQVAGPSNYAKMGTAAGKVLKYNGVTYNWTMPDDLDQ